jgi:hypothetical protein
MNTALRAVFGVPDRFRHDALKSILHAPGQTVAAGSP